MRTKPPADLPIFRSALQARLLALLLLDSDGEWTFRDLRDRTHSSHGALHRELQRLMRAGLVQSQTIGRTYLYRPAVDSPLFEPLRELLRRAVGAEAELKRRLAGIDGVKAAAIYGSWAREEAEPESDIDLLVVGEADYDALVAAVRDAEALTGREVHLVAYRPDELRRRLEERNGFVVDILSSELTELVGRLDDFRADA